MTKISDAGLVPSVNDSQKMPTGEPGDKAISVGQIKTHVKSDLSKSDVGLSNVDNTSDVDKPVSTLQAAADLAAENNAKSYADGKWTAVDATPSVKGIAKLYNDLSASNTDGAVTQSAIKTAVDAKWTAADASESTKGIAELLDQTESETVATAGAASGTDHTRVVSGRGLWWFWAKIKTLAQTFNAAITATDFTATNQSGTGYKIAILDSAGKIVRYANGTVDPTTGAITLAGVDDLAASHTLAVVNQTGNVIIKLWNNQVTEFGGTTSFWKVLPGIGTGLAGLEVNEDQAQAYKFGDEASLIAYLQTTIGNKAFVFAMQHQQNQNLGFVNITRQYHEETSNTAADDTLIAAIPVASGEMLEVTVLTACARLVTRMISCEPFKSISANDGGTYAGLAPTITSRRITATTGEFFVVYNDTDDQWELWFKNETGTGYIYSVDVQLLISKR